MRLQNWLQPHAPSARQGRLRVGVAAITTVCALTGVNAPIASGAGDEAKTALIVDASGSMWAPDGAGQLRSTTANQVAHKIIDTLPESHKLALLTYGTSTGNTEAEMEAGCQDVKTLVRLGGSREDIAAEVDGLVPSGYTPIAKALRAADKELGTGGKRRIVLVSDGIDTCAPPEMAEVAKEIHNSGGDITIDVVGLNVDDDVRNQLTELAKAGGGTYADGWEADTLIAGLAAAKGVEKKQSQDNKEAQADEGEKADEEKKDGEKEEKKDGEKEDSSAQSSESTSASSEVASSEAEADSSKMSEVPSETAEPMAVKGAESAEEAPELSVADADENMPHARFFTDSLAANGDQDKTQHWSVELKEGQQINAAFLVQAPEGENNQALTITPRVTGPDGKTCEVTAEKGRAKGDAATAISATVLSKIAEKNTECPPGRYDLTLTRSGELGADKDLPLQFSTWAMPRIDDTTLPQASDTPEVEALKAGNSEGELKTDADMAAAPSVEPGTYEVTLTPGETRWFKVPVKDGQRLQMRLDADAIGAENHSLTWNAFGPLFHGLKASTFEGDATTNGKDTATVELSAEEKTTAGFASAPIRWANLKAGGNAATSFASGEQLVGLRHNAPEGSEPVKANLVVAATGKAENGPDLGGKSMTGAHTNKSNSSSGVWSGIWWLFLLLFAVGIIATWLSGRKKKQEASTTSTDTV